MAVKAKEAIFCRGSSHKVSLICCYCNAPFQGSQAILPLNWRGRNHVLLWSFLRFVLLPFLPLISKLHCFAQFNPVSLLKLPLWASMWLCMWLCISVTDTGQQPDQIPSGHQCLSAVVTSLSCSQHSVGIFFQRSLAWGAAADSEHTPYQYLKSY